MNEQNQELEREEEALQYLAAELQTNLRLLQPEARKLLVDISARLVVGQERYGGFKFAEHDLDQMSVEEIEDFIVYITAKGYLRRLNGALSR